MAVQVSEPMLFPLPTVDGCVHGIVGKHPTQVQCDDCLRVFSSDSTIAAVQEVLFNSRQPQKYLRCCAECWAARGWTNSNEGWKNLG